MNLEYRDMIDRIDSDYYEVFNDDFNQIMNENEFTLNQLREGEYNK